MIAVCCKSADRCRAQFSSSLLNHFTSSSMAHQHHPYSENALLDAFRTHFHRFDGALREALQGPSDANVLARLGDDFDEYASMVQEVCYVTSGTDHQDAKDL